MVHIKMIGRASTLTSSKALQHDDASSMEVHFSEIAIEAVELKEETTSEVTLTRKGQMYWK